MLLNAIQMNFRCMLSTVASHTQSRQHSTEQSNATERCHQSPRAKWPTLPWSRSTQESLRSRMSCVTTGCSRLHLLMSELINTTAI